MTKPKISKSTLAAYSITAGIVGVTAQTSDADVVDYVPNGGSPVILVTGGFDDFFVDINNDTTNDFWLIGSSYFSLNPQGTSRTIGAGSDLTVLASGEMIDVTKSYNWFTNFTNFVGQRGYVGLRFDGFYGYLDVEVSGDGNTLTLYGGAFESNAGSGIMSGASTVPEPSGMALLASGAAGLTFWRRRKRS